MLGFMSVELHPGFFADRIRFVYYPRNSIARHVFCFLAYFFDFDRGVEEYFSE